MERDRAGCCDEKVDGPPSSQQSGQRYDRQRHGEHPEAEVRRRHLATSAVSVQIEETEARRQGQQGNRNRRAREPPGFSQLADSQRSHRV